MKHFLSVDDVSDVGALISKALDYKAHPLRDTLLGAGKRLGLLFLNPSLRTRLSTQVAARNLGLEPVVFDVGNDGWKLELEDGVVMNGHSAEHIRDAAPVLGAYFDIIAIRSFPALQDREQDYSELLIRQLVRYAGVPVISLESATLHPLQSLADLVTIREHHNSQRRPKIVLTWAPHIKPLPQCVANSFAQWTNAWNGADFIIAQPQGYELCSSFTQGAKITHDQQSALKDADFIYTKSWSSVDAYGTLPPVSGDWMLTPEKLRDCPGARVMHCLPVRRNVELGDAVLDSAISLVTLQAANRIWAAQAVLSEILQPSIHATA